MLKKIKLTDSMRAAMKVLESVRVHEGLERTFLVEGYNNGREQGMGLSAYLTAAQSSEPGMYRIVWAQDRHSERVVVYTSTCNEHWALGGVPSDRAYAAKMLFKSPEAAANHVFTHILRIANKVR